MGLFFVVVSCYRKYQQCAHEGAEFRGDRDIVMQAVMQHGDALQYASDELKDDHEIVMKAVSQDRDGQPLDFPHRGSWDNTSHGGCELEQTTQNARKITKILQKHFRELFCDNFGQALPNTTPLSPLRLAREKGTIWANRRSNLETRLVRDVH